MEKGLQTIELCNNLKNQYLSLDMSGKNKLLKMLYRTVIIRQPEEGSKIPDLDLVWNPGWAELVRLHELEIGARLMGKNEKMAPRAGLEPAT